MKEIKNRRWVKIAQQRAYKYQYETSPRKLKPEYEPIKSPYTNKKSSAKKQENKKTKPKKAINEKKQKRQLVLYISIIFLMLLAISYRNSLIDERFSQVQTLKKELAVAEKENEQLEVNIESMLNLKNIEQSAEELLGMQKLDNEQKIYITLDKKDYVEKATEEIKIEEEKSWFSKLVDILLGNM